MMSKSLIGAACAAMILTASSLSAQAATPRQFLENAIRGDNSEIMLGRVAQMRADSPSVQEFGRTLFEDHSKAKAQASAVAVRLRVPIPQNPLPAALEERQRLAQLSGEQFDREFVRYMVKDHRGDIKEFHKMARNTGPVSRMARMQLPTLQKHLDMAVALYREPKVAEVPTR